MEFGFLENVSGLKIIVCEHLREENSTTLHIIHPIFYLLKEQSYFLNVRSLATPARVWFIVSNHLIFLFPACSCSVFSILFLSLSLPVFLSPYCNGRLAINSALVWPETLLELNMNDWDCSSTCHWECRMRPRRGKGGSKYPTYETNHQAGVCCMLSRFYPKMQSF